MKYAFAAVVPLMMAVQSYGGEISPPYLDPSLPVEDRVEDLMSRMTLEDKIAQMCQYAGLEHIRAAEKEITEEELLNGHARGFYKGLHSDGVVRMVQEGKIGSFLHVTTLEEANYLQSLAEKSPLKIPLLIGIDAIHGNGLYRGSTIYPSPITAASSFSPELWEKACRQTADEMRATGSHWAFAPNIEIATDARWGRVGETFGEDPYLVSRMGTASVRGLQTGDIGNDGAVLACVKHLLGGGSANNGTNAAPVELGEGKMRNIYLQPFKAAIEETSPYTLMPAHNEVNGVPCHCNRWLMTDVVRGEYGFDGFIVSDWMDIEALSRVHHVAEDNTEAFMLAVNAGIDMHMHGPEFAEALAGLVREGKVPGERVDEACRKILYAKFRLGLFEDRYVDPADAAGVVFSREHQQTALELARRSVVLLENDGILPLSPGKYERILLTGPNADNQSIMGDWTFDQPRENYHTVLDGVKEMADGAEVDFVDVGWNLRNISDDDIENAAAAARRADLAVVVLGEDSFREHWADKTCGENRCRTDITLWGRQQELLEAVARTGVPVVVILVNGRPLAVPWISENVSALLEAWEPGSMGGRAIGEILFGKVNPSGKLPITIPRHVGQITATYNHKPSQYSHPAIDIPKTPLYQFGYGLSYTEFEYSGLELSSSEIRPGESVRVSVSVTNKGTIDGEEVVQMYVGDDFSSETRPVKELKGFRRVALKAGETARVEFEIGTDDLSYYGSGGRLLLEPGKFTVMVGSSSMNNDLLKAKLELK